MHVIQIIILCTENRCVDVKMLFRKGQTAKFGKNNHRCERSLFCCLVAKRLLSFHNIGDEMK
jgi:hypothetical protein